MSLHINKNRDNSSELEHNEGTYTCAKGNASHAEGYKSIAEGNYSHAEGQGTIASNLVWQSFI